MILILNVFSENHIRLKLHLRYNFQWFFLLISTDYSIKYHPEKSSDKNCNIEESML